MIKKTRNARVPEEVLKDLEGALDKRYQNKLMKRKEFHLTEGFRLLKRMPEWNVSMEKLKKLPRKEDVK